MNAKQKLMKLMAARGKLKDFPVRWSNEKLLVTASFSGELAALVLVLEPDGWRLVNFWQKKDDEMTGEFEIIEDNQDEATRENQA